MGSPIIHEFKRQASFFLKEKIKTARLALTDVTSIELLTEEVTNGDPWAPDTRTMGIISRAAFEVDEYYRIVDILHKRLMKFDRKTWRVCYKALLLLEHLLTHGPLRVAEEFQCDRDVIKEMQSFQFVDEKGFNWGLSVRNLSIRISKLLEDELFLKEERARTQKITREIRGFGTFPQRSLSENGSLKHDESLKDLASRTYWRRNSYYGDHGSGENELVASREKLLGEETQHFHKDNSSVKIIEKGCTVEDHPFCVSDHHIRASLLST